MALTSIGFNDGSLMRDFAPIFQNWFEIHQTYKWNNTDPLYWYNERANVGTFAGAVWRSGFHALEEYSSTKRPDEDQDKNFEKLGRVDLWIYPNEMEYVIEAKQVREKVGDNFSGVINSALKKAVGDVAKSTEGGLVNVKYLGLTFIIPMLTAADRDDYTGWFKNYTDTSKEVKCDFFANWFQDVPLPIRDDKLAQPGISVFGRLWDGS